jgi:predicted nucleotide-binding protein (sugar kinase/HSP70/actin superfamily)
MTALDDIEIVTNKVRATAKEPAGAARIYRESIREIDRAADYRTLKKIVSGSMERLGALPKDSSIIPLHFLVVGEIYVVLDPYANADVESELGKLGVVTTRSLYISRWVKNSLLRGIYRGDQWKEVHEAAKPYLKRDVGGDGWETVGEKVIGSRHYDGMIHLAPFTCMPEGIAQNIMPVTREKLPVLAIYCDEQTSKAGTITRLEAFVDMIRFKKSR